MAKLIPGDLAGALWNAAYPGESFRSVVRRHLEAALEHGPGCCCSNCPWSGDHGWDDDIDAYRVHGKPVEDVVTDLADYTDRRHHAK